MNLAFLSVLVTCFHKTKQQKCDNCNWYSLSNEWHKTMNATVKKKRNIHGGKYCSREIYVFVNDDELSLMILLNQNNAVGISRLQYQTRLIVSLNCEHFARKAINMIGCSSTATISEILLSIKEIVYQVFFSFLLNDPLKIMLLTLTGTLAAVWLQAVQRFHFDSK